MVVFGSALGALPSICGGMLRLRLREDPVKAFVNLLVGDTVIAVPLEELKLAHLYVFENTDAQLPILLKDEMRRPVTCFSVIARNEEGKHFG